MRYNLQPRLDLPQRTNWEAPPPGVFKLNTDGATFEEDNAYGVGVVIRDWRGRFVAGKCKRFTGMVEAHKAEATAVKEGLQLASDLGIRALILESDVRVVVEDFGTGSMDRSHNGLIMVEAYRLALGFNYFKAQYTPRFCNSVADKLAKSAKD